jgi:hypothetical protein
MNLTSLQRVKDQALQDLEVIENFIVGFYDVAYHMTL